MSTPASIDFRALEGKAIRLDGPMGGSSSSEAQSGAHSRPTAAQHVGLSVTSPTTAGRHRPTLRLAKNTTARDGRFHPRRLAGRPLTGAARGLRRPRRSRDDRAVRPEQSESLAVVTSGAAITRRLVPAATRRQRVSDVLTDSARSGESAAVFDSPRRRTGRPRVCTSTSPGSWRAPWGGRRRLGCTGLRSRTSAPGAGATSAIPTAERRRRKPAARTVGPTGVPVGPTVLVRCRLVPVYPVRPSRGCRASRRRAAASRGCPEARPWGGLGR